MDLFDNLLLVSLIAALYSTTYSGAPVSRTNRIVGPRTQSSQKDFASEAGVSDEERFFGPNVQVFDYDSTEFLFQNGGPVQASGEMNTGFYTSSCWINANSDYVTKIGAEQIAWRRIEGLIDTKRLQSFFGTQDGPDQDSLVAYSGKRRRSEDAAYFESCSISCLDGPVVVNFRYWMSDGVILEVCYRRTFFDESGPIGCQKVPASRQPGPSHVVLNIEDDYPAIIIKASNFINDKGSVVILDDMYVTYKLCDDKTASTEISAMPPGPSLPIRTVTPLIPTRMPIIASPAPTSPRRTPPSSLLRIFRPNADANVHVTGGNAAATATVTPEEAARVCRAVECSFAQGLCAYKTILLFPAFGGVMRLFRQQSGAFHNQLTGIRNGPANRPYVAAYLFAFDIAGLSSGSMNTKEDLVMKFDLFEATQGIRTKLCLGKLSACFYRTRGAFKNDERMWKPIAWKIPAGTTQISLVSENSGSNEGAVGYANIRLFKMPADGDVQTATERVCQSFSPMTKSINRIRTRSRHRQRTFAA